MLNNSVHYTGHNYKILMIIIKLDYNFIKIKLIINIITLLKLSGHNYKISASKEFLHFQELV